MKYCIKSHLIALTLLLASPQAFGWSGYVHKIIAQIAAQNLDSNVKNQIVAITGEDLEKSANWPDAVKDSKQWKHTKGYHYKNIDGKDYFADLQSQTSTQEKKGDMIRALVIAEDTIRSSSKSQNDKKLALRFMIHLIGDIHQPLHAGYRSDNGGNSVGIKWFTKNTNFHSLWDGSLTASFAYQKNLSNSMTSQDYIDEMRKPSAAEIKKWRKSYIMDWFNETLDGRDHAYVGIKDDSQAYYNRNIDLANDRLLMAGHRLAGWLNDIFKGVPMSSDALKLRKNLDALVGDDISIDFDSRSQLNRADGEDDSDADSCNHQ